MQRVPRELDSAFSLDGMWRARGGDTTAGGTLTYDPTLGLRLRVAGPQTLRGSCLTADHGPLVIEGEVTGSPFGQVVTLQDCYKLEVRNEGALATEVYLANFAFVGAEVDEQVSVRFANMTFSELDHFAKPSRGYYDLKPTANRKLETYSVRFTPPAGDLKAIVDGAEIELKFSSWWANHLTNVTFDTRSEFVVTLEHAVAFDDFLKRFVQPLENFVTFATGRINSVRELRVASRRVPSLKSSYASVIYQPIQAKGNRSSWLYQRGLFSLLDLEADFPDRLVRWFALHRYYHTVLSLFFGTLYHSSMYLEARFLSLVQAVEGYHRQRADMTQCLLPDDEFREMKRELLATAPAVGRKTLKRALVHANEVSLEQRLRELMAVIGPTIPGVMPEEERRTFPTDCARTRNKLAHHLPGNDTIDAHRLSRMTDMLTRVIAAGLMLEMGFSPGETRHHLQRGASVIRANRPSKSV